MEANDLSNFRYDLQSGKSTGSTEPEHVGISCQRAKSLVVRIEDDVYDDVDEATYQEMIMKRREDNFIEDDLDDGDYIDNGQEDWDDENYSEGEGTSGKRTKVCTWALGHTWSAHEKGIFSS
eukprot:6190268-Pleurochrysis_carterae.AAC.4